MGSLQGGQSQRVGDTDESDDDGQEQEGVDEAQQFWLI
jgi:hypothetical protein